MGMGAGFGQSMGGQTGVGSSSTQSNAPTGGKGGGFSTPTSAQNPYASSQPQQPQTQQYQPMGGNVFGYNMARLSSQMDPSATLPAPQQPMGQQPQYTQYEMGQPGPRDSFGGKGGGMGGYGDYFGFGPQEPSFFQPVQGGEFQTQQPNPFDQGFDAQQERVSQLERQLADLTSRQQTQAQERDTGEVVADLPEPFEEFGVGKTPEETAAAEAAKQPTPDYEFSKRVRYTPEQLADLKRADIRALYKADIKKQQADVAELKKRLKAATTPEDKLAIRKKLDANIASVKGLKKEMGAYVKPNPSSGGVRYAYGSGQPQTNTGAPNTGFPFTGFGSAPVQTQKPKEEAPTLADARNRNAAGGVIHTGMTSNLKKMLKNK